MSGQKILELETVVTSLKSAFEQYQRDADERTDVLHTQIEDLKLDLRMELKIISDVSNRKTEKVSAQMTQMAQMFLGMKDSIDAISKKVGSSVQSSPQALTFSQVGLTPPPTGIELPPMNPEPKTEAPPTPTMGTSGLALQN